MRKIVVLALALSTGCAATSASHRGSDSLATPWGAVRATTADCQATPMLCRQINGASTPYLRSGPFMPE
jgi:hypothetical protein